MSNHLPIRVSRAEETGSWEFGWDEDALIAQAQARPTSFRQHFIPSCCSALSTKSAMVMCLLSSARLQRSVRRSACLRTSDASPLSAPAFVPHLLVRACSQWTCHKRTAALSVGVWQQEGVGDDTEVLFVGCLPVEIDVSEQEVRMLLLARSISRCRMPPAGEKLSCAVCVAAPLRVVS